MKHPMKTIRTLCALLPIAVVAGCSNPADNVPEAKVAAKTNGPASATAKKSDAPSRSYVFGPETSTIDFVGSKVTGSHRGGFKKFSGELHGANGRLADPAGKVVIDMTSIWSDNDRLTGHLKTPDFFDVGKFPTATFAATSVAHQGTNSIVTGDLTLHGITKQVSFPANIQVSDDKAELTAEFFINRFDFDVKYAGKADDLIRKEVVLKLKIKATPGSAKL
jgi:polyisoprenoid-binding protein YceI